MGCGGSIPVDAAARSAYQAVQRKEEEATAAYTLSHAPIVQISYGTVRGSRDLSHEQVPEGNDLPVQKHGYGGPIGPVTPGLEVFKNIPYAWAKRLGLPVPPSGWHGVQAWRKGMAQTGVRDATEFGPGVCPFTQPAAHPRFYPSTPTIRTPCDSHAQFCD